MQNTKKIRFKSGISIGLVVFLAFTKESNTPLLGTWSGTLGKAKIIACFQTEYGKYSNGYYYYLKYRQPIRLIPKGNNTWDESGTYKLKFNTVTDRIATGEWKDPEKNITLPIKLFFEEICQEDKESTTPCTCNRFNAKLETLPNPTIDTINFSTSQTIRRIVMDTNEIYIEWFDILEDGLAIKKINSSIKTIISDDITDAESFYRCRRNMLASFGINGWDGYRHSVQLHLWTKHFIVIEENNGGFCGGAHPFWGTGYKTFDTNTGDEIDMWSWFNDKYLSGWGAGKELNELILSRNPRKDEPEENDCINALNENSNYNVWPDTVGLHFRVEFGHCCRACDEEFFVPYKELMPYLSSSGKQRFKAINEKIED